MRDNPTKIKTVLQDRVSPETAQVVPDYPYGRLRCQIRYWLERKTGHGTRLMSQTTNPKRTNLFDTTKNKPHAGTYDHGLCLLVIEQATEHVKMVVLNEWYGPLSHAEVRRVWDQLTEAQRKSFAFSEQGSRRYHGEAWAAWDAEQEQLKGPPCSTPHTT